MSVYSKNDLSLFGENDAWVKLFDMVPKNATVLDVGCSSGRLGKELAKQKHVTVTGIDIDKDDVKLAKKNLSAAYVRNIEKDELSDLGKFDVIIMADVIEHLIDPVSSLKKLKGLLNPKGTLLFSIPNMANVTTRIDLLLGRFEYKDWGLLDRTHLHFYDAVEVERVLSAAGFQVSQTNNTVRTIPEPILKKELDRVGIAITPKLMKHLNTTEAFTYQFIGSATPSSKPVRFALNTTSALDSVSREIDRLNAEHDKGILNKQKEVEAAQVESAKLRAELEKVQTELTEILNSKAWKLAGALRNVRSVIPSKKN